MRFIILILLLISPVAYAQKNIGRESFMINVRPVLNGIIGDFYQMVGLFPEFPKEIVPLIHEFDTLAPDKELLRQQCPRTIDIKCKDSLNSLRQKLQKVKALSLVLLSQQRMSQSPHLSTLAGLRLLAEFDSELEEVKGLLDNSAFLVAASVPHQKKETYTLLKELEELGPLLSLAVVEYIPFTYQEDFRHFFFNFVQPIQQQISKSSNHEFINRNINSLNFAINLLNMTLTKKKKTPEGMGPYLATLHNRWNSILRMYF